MEKRQEETARLCVREMLLEKLKGFTLLSDVFLSVALRDQAACQHVLRLLTGKEDLTVREVRTQYRISKILSHDAILDVLAEDEEYDDGLHVVYVNAEVDDGSETAALMRYFKTSDPEDKSQGALSERVHFLKCEKEGIEFMCEITEEIYEIGKNEGRKEGREEGREEGILLGKTETAKKTARNMAERGAAAEVIAEIIEESVETVRQWLGKNTEPKKSDLVSLL